MGALTREAVIAALDAEGEKSIEDRLAELTKTDDGNQLTEAEKKAKEEADAKTAADAKAKEEADAKAAADAAADTDKPGIVTLTAAQFAELQTEAKAGAAAAVTIDKARREQIVKSAFSAGKIARTEQEQWLKALEKDEEGTKTLLSSLQPRFAVTEIGDDAPTNLSDAYTKAEEEFINSL